MIDNKKDPVWAFSEHDRNEIKISLLTLVLGPISRFLVAALAKTKWRLKHAPQIYVHSVATFVHWNENSKLSTHLQFTCCSVSPAVLGNQVDLFTLTRDRFTKRRKYQQCHQRGRLFALQRKIFMDIATVCAGSEILSNNNRIHFYILNSNFQNLINNTSVCVN